jgi:hypothetical protein
MESNTPTALEIVQKHLHDPNGKSTAITDAMIEFAKLHVEAALKMASEKARTKEDVAIFAEGTYNLVIVDKNSILNAYPLINIK